MPPHGARRLSISARLCARPCTRWRPLARLCPHCPIHDGLSFYPILFTAVHTRGAFGRETVSRGAPRGWPRCAPPAPARRSIRPARCAAQPRSTLTGAHRRPGPRGSLPRAWPTPAHQRAHRPPALPAGRNGGWAGPPRWSSVLVARLCCRLPAARCAPLYLTLLAVLPAQAIGWQMASTARTRA